MSSRKESIKKALGIPEYPWSSDDEESSSQTAVQDIHLLQASDTRWPGTSAMPGPSGIPGPSTISGPSAISGPSVPPSRPTAPASTPARRSQPKLDRDFFWSIVNRSGVFSSRVHEPSVSNTMRSIPPSTASQYRERNTFNRERQNTLARSPVADIHRILQTMSSRRTSGTSGSSRSSLFTPSSASGRVGRTQASFRRVNRPGPLPALPQYTRSASAPSIHPSGHRSSSVARSRLPRPAYTQAPSNVPTVLDVVNVNEHDEESVQPATVPPPIFPETHENNNSIEEIVEVSSHEISAENVAFVDETVDLDPPDDAEPNPNTVLEMNPEATASTTEGNIVNTNETRGSKRKSDADDENMEVFTVTDFNQSLLRLLECPVCLEWMEPPISQCRRGHLVCSRCRARLASCPVCRTTFSSVRNRAMEGVAEMLRYPCRHGCGREVRLRRRAPHEASCAARKYQCPAPACADKQPLSHQALPQHFQSEHKTILRCGQRNTFSLKVNTVQHANWVINAHYEFFHLRADVDIRTWGVIVYVAYIGPKCNAKNYSYEVSVDGQNHSRRIVYSRATHSDLESSSFNVSLQDCFHLTVDQALNFLRFKSRHSEPEKFFDFIVDITECDGVAVPREESDS